MAIHIDVMADLHKRSVEKVAGEIQARFDKVGFEVSPDLNKRDTEAVAQYLERRFNNIHAEVKVDVDRTALSRMAQVGHVADNVTDSLTSMGRAFGETNQSIRDMGTNAFQTSRGLITLAAPMAAIVAIDFGKWAVQATGSLGLLPAVAAAATAGIGTLSIATHGFGDAIKDMGDPKKFAEGLAMLSPNAQQAALEIKALVDGPLGDLKRATQDAFFANWAQQLDNLNNTLGPSLQKLTTSISTSFNQMFLGITDQMMTPEGTAQIQTIFDNLSETFHNLVPAAQSFSQAFMDITEVGSGFLPGIADSVSSLAANFADFIHEAKESGKLGEWIQNGIDAIAMLAEELWKITGQVAELFGAGGDGQASIESFKDDLESISDILKIMSGDFSEVGNELTLQFNRWGEDLKQNMFGAINAVSKAINTWLDGMSHIPILGGAVPDFRLPEVGNAQWSGGGGGFGTGPGSVGGTLGAPQMNGARPNPPTRGGFPQRPVPAVPPDGAGGKPSQKERRDALIAGLDPALWQVDPFGGMAGMQMGPGANPQDVLEQQRNVISEAHDVEEANKNLLALQQDNTATAQDIDEAKWKQVEEGWQLQEAQVKLAEKMAGTAKDVKSGADELSAALDPDLGLGKGLAGMADNLVRFLGKLALAGPMAKGQQMINASEAATGIKGGYGMFGMMGAQNLSQGLSPLLGQPMAGAGPASAGGGYQSSYTPTGGMYPSATAAAGALPARPTGGYIGDAALLANVPAGQYTQSARGDLTQGLADCSSAVEDLVNLMQGQPTAGASMYTGNAAQWLTGRGFQPGMGGPGDMRVGFNAGHMQATLPGGTPFNWGGSASAARGGVGGTGAYDPSFTSHYYLPAGGGPAGPATVGSGPLGTPLPAAPTRSGGGGPAISNLFSPANTNPALNSPGAPTAPLPFSGGGGNSPILPTYGAGRNASPDQPGTVPRVAGQGPTRIGGLAPPASINPGGEGFGIMPGGTIDSIIQGSIQAAGAAGGMFGGGAGGAAAAQAVQTAIKLGNRAIQFGGEAAGIGVSGLMETFLPTGGSELANNNWLTRIGGAIAAGAPAIPNLAGGKTGEMQQQGPLTPEQVAAAQKDPNLAGFQNAPVVGTLNYNNIGAPEDRAGADLTHHLSQVQQAPMGGMGKPR